MTASGARTAAGDLRERLGDADAGVRLGAAAEAFLRPDPPVELREELAALLADPAEDARKLAVHALGRIGPPAFSDLARALDTSQPPTVRAFGCQAVGAHGPAAATLAAPIAECLSAAEEIVRSAACVALTRVGRPAVPHLVRVLERASEAGTLVAAADAAGGLGEEAAEGADPLRRAAGHADARVRLACADALGRVTGRPASALPVLVPAARDADEEVRAEALRRIGTLREDGRAAEETLLAGGADGSPRVRAAAAIAIALAGVRGDGMVDVLGRLAEDPVPDVRIAAAAAAAHLRERARPLLPRLERLSVAPEPRVAAAATSACEAIEGRPARVREAGP